MRELPKNLTAEQAVLSTMLVDPSCKPLVKERLSEADLCFEKHQYLFSVILDTESDLVLIENALKEKGVLDRAGGREYLMELAAMATGSAALKHYIEIVKECSQKRQLIFTCHEVIQNAAKMPIEDLCDFVKKKAVQIKDNDKVPKHIREMNKNHAVLMLGNKCCVLHESIDPVFNRETVEFYSPQDFHAYYQNRTYAVGIRKAKVEGLPTSKLWMQSPYRREYSGIVFDPIKTPIGYYNLFKGFAVEPRKGTWMKFQDHIYEVICNKNSKYCDWLLAWLANKVQNPGGKRVGTAIVLRGPQGTGKGVFATNFGKIFGRHFLHISNPSHLVGKFNKHLADCALAFADEAFWAGDKKSEGILKDLITEEVFMIEQKFRDALPMPNRVHLIIASNADWVVPVGIRERRFCVLDVSDKRKGDYDYFKAITEEMDHGGREAMLYDLQRWPIKVNLREVPQTEALQDQKKKTLNSVHAFWLDCLTTQSIPVGLTEVWLDEVVVKNFYNAYVDHAKDRGIRHRAKIQEFGKQLKAVCPSLKRVRPSSAVNSGRPRIYLIPNYEICREEFRRITGIEIDTAD